MREYNDRWEEAERATETRRVNLLAGVKNTWRNVCKNVRPFVGVRTPRFYDGEMTASRFCRYG